MYLPLVQLTHYRKSAHAETPLPASNPKRFTGEQIMKKLLSAVLIAIVIISTSNTCAAEKNIKLRVWEWISHQGEGPVYRQVVESYLKEHPNIAVCRTTGSKSLIEHHPRVGGRDALLAFCRDYRSLRDFAVLILRKETVATLYPRHADAADYFVVDPVFYHLHKAWPIRHPHRAGDRLLLIHRFFLRSYDGGLLSQHSDLT